MTAITNPIGQVIGPVIRRIAPPYFVPIDLFNTGEQGAWYDPSDITTLFQDSAGTTPVTAIGQSVGLMLDKSGRGNHASQTTAGNRPVLQQESDGRLYLAFDGATSNRWLQTAAINFTGTNKVTVFAGLQKLSDAALGLVVELSTNASTVNGGFYLTAPRANAAAGYQFASRGTLAVLATTPNNYAAPITNVLTGSADISADIARLRVNGVQAASSTADQGTGNYGNHVMYIGRRGGTTLPFNGRLYGLIVRGAESTAEQIAEGEKWLAQKTGVIL